MNKPHPPQKILNLGVEEISFLCPGIGILVLATRVIMVKCFVLEDVLFFFWLLIHVDGLIHFNIGLLALDDLCKKGTIFTVIIVRYILRSSFFSYNR